MHSNIATHFLERKPSLEHLLSDLQRGKKERHSPCWRCGGNDRFIVFLKSGRGWCRQCHWKGDSIQLLIDRDGLTFLEAKKALGLDTDRAPSAKRQATIHSLALAAAKRDYQTWQRRIFDALIEQYRELSTYCDIAEVGYRATVRRPDLYTAEERSFWAHWLASLYDRIALLESGMSNELARDLDGYLLLDALDIFTCASNEAARFFLWQEEVDRG